MSLKALALEALARNNPCTEGRNTPQTRATNGVTAEAARATNGATGDDLAERGAIIEEGAGVPAAWADEFARLQALPVPAGVSEPAWRAMIDAAGRFLDRWGGKAAALGWTAGELIGFDPDAPMNRRDRRGAALFLDGAEVIAVTNQAITGRTGGVVQRVYRRAGFAVPSKETPQ
ncbi:MAG: hypothetical protein ACR2FH_08725 [Caulobacteraceae bacterium]